MPLRSGVLVVPPGVGPGTKSVVTVAVDTTFYAIVSEAHHLLAAFSIANLVCYVLLGLLVSFACLYANKSGRKTDGGKQVSVLTEKEAVHNTTRRRAAKALAG